MIIFVMIPSESITVDSDGITSSIYDPDCASNISTLGIFTSLTLCPSLFSRSVASIQILTSEPVATIISSGTPDLLSISVYAPLERFSADGYLFLSITGTFCLVKRMAVGSVFVFKSLYPCSGCFRGVSRSYYC